MKQEYFKIGLFILAAAFVFVCYDYSENGKYQVVSTTIPDGLSSEAQQHLVSTVVRINTRTGEAESYYDISYGTFPNLKVKRGWTPLLNQERDLSKEGRGN